MERIKKYVGYLFFWGIFAVLLLCLSLLLEPKRNSEAAGVPLRDTKGMCLKGEPEETVDVFFFGDSITFTGISPMQVWEETGNTSYVCGQSGQKIVEAYYWLSELYEEQKPEVIVLETNTLYNNDNTMSEADYDLGEMLQHYIPAVKYHNRWKHLYLNDITGRRSYGEQDLFKGFEIKRDVLPYTDGIYMKDTEKKENMDVTSVYYLNKIKAFCDKRGVELLLVSIPSPDSWNMEKHNAVEEYAKKQGLPYLDMNLCLDEIGIDWQEDSMDGGVHLNCAGAGKVTGYAAAYLADNYKLEDHRGEEGYELWMKNADTYRNLAPDTTNKEKTN